MQLEGDKLALPVSPSPLSPVPTPSPKPPDAAVLTVEPSEGVGEVVVPLLGRSRRVSVDGVLRWDGERSVNGVGAGLGEPRLEGDGLVFPRIDGAHTFAWSGDDREE